MAKEVIPVDPQLSANLRTAKAQMAEAEKAVFAAEIALYLAAGDKVPEKGTIHITGCKIATGFYEKYDQAQLDAAEKQWAAKSNLPFPFKREWKADGTLVKAVRENSPDAWKLIEPALTLTPKKPTFTLED